MDTSELEIARSKRASALLEDGGVFREAWDALDARITDEWRLTKPADTARREELHRLLQAMAGLENILRGYVADGAIALERIGQAERDRAAGF